MFDTLSQTTAIIFAATSRAVLASPRPPAPCPGGCFWGFGFPQFEQYERERREDLVVSLSLRLREGVNGEMQRRAMLLALLWGLGPAPVPAWAARASSNAGRSGRVGARVVPPPSAAPDSWGSLAPVPDFVAAGSADGERKGKQRELEALRNILQGDAFDKAIAREEEEREVDDERELLRAQREKRRRERAGEVAFLRSVAIRDAQMGDTLPGDPAAAGDHVCRDLNSDPASEPVHFQCDSGARVAGQQAGVGADAHSDPEMEDPGSTLSAQANIHAQQAVQSVLRGLRQESGGDASFVSCASAAIATHERDPARARERRDRRRRLLLQAVEEEKAALRREALAVQMQAAREEGEARREGMQRAQDAHAALVHAVAGPAAQGTAEVFPTTLAAAAAERARQVFGEKKVDEPWEERRVGQSRGWNKADDEALAV